MSTNITSWRTKEMADFRIWMNALFEDDELEVSILKKQKALVTGYSEGFEIFGELKNDGFDSYLKIEKIENYGVGSGIFWERFLSLLKNTQGLLIATQIWDGRDFISELVVKDGSIDEGMVTL